MPLCRSTIISLIIKSMARINSLVTQCIHTSPQMKASVRWFHRFPCNNNYLCNNDNFFVGIHITWEFSICHFCLCCKMPFPKSTTNAYNGVFHLLDCFNIWLLFYQGKNLIYVALVFLKCLFFSGSVSYCCHYSI